MATQVEPVAAPVERPALEKAPAFPRLVSLDAFRGFEQHEGDLKRGLGRAPLPEALVRKYPNAGRPDFTTAWWKSYETPHSHGEGIHCPNRDRTFIDQHT